MVALLGVVDPRFDALELVQTVSHLALDVLSDRNVLLLDLAPVHIGHAAGRIELKDPLFLLAPVDQSAGEHFAEAANLNNPVPLDVGSRLDAEAAQGRQFRRPYAAELGLVNVVLIEKFIELALVCLLRQVHQCSLLFGGQAIEAVLQLAHLTYAFAKPN